MEEDLKYGLNQIRKHLILTQDHLTSGNCPTCIREKHLPSLEAYAEESLPMTRNEELRNWLIKVRDFALDLRKKLGDIL